MEKTIKKPKTFAIFWMALCISYFIFFEPFGSYIDDEERLTIIAITIIPAALLIIIGLVWRVDVEKLIPKDEQREKENLFRMFFLKLLSASGLTSGVGFVVIGGIWFFYFLVSYFALEPQSAMQQIAHENLFSQGQMGLLIAAVGIVIIEIKRSQKE